MGGGGGQPENTTTTTKTEIDPWMKGRLQELVGLQDQYNLKPYQSYGGPLNAPLSSGQQAAGSVAQAGANGGLYTQQLAQQGLAGIIAGNYNVTPQNNPYLNWTTQVGTNPYAGQNQYLQGMIDKSNSDITNQFQKAQGNLATQFSTGGAFGGSAMQQAVNDQNRTLADGLANNENQYRFQDYTTQQGLAESALNRSVQAQQTDLARNSALYQQQFQNQLSAQGQNAQNMLGAAQGVNGISALQAQYNGQLAGIGQAQQDKAQGDIDQAYNDWYQRTYGYDQQRINNLGNVINGMSGQFTGSSTSGANPAYKPRTAGGALASAGAGAATGAMFGPWGAVAGGAIGAASYYL